MGKKKKDLQIEQNGAERSGMFILHILVLSLALLIFTKVLLYSYDALIVFLNTRFSTGIAQDRGIDLLHFLIGPIGMCLGVLYMRLIWHRRDRDVVFYLYRRPFWFTYYYNARAWVMGTPAILIYENTGRTGPNTKAIVISRNVARRLEGVRYTSGDRTASILREGRGGEIYGK